MSDMPWVIKNGDDTKYRAWVHGLPAWVSNRDDALQLVRRKDAEALAQEDLDPCFIRQLTEPEPTHCNSCGRELPIHTCGMGGCPHGGDL